jgi:uncharacterized protein YigA (DUF484 family)
MEDRTAQLEALRARILSDPDTILDDREVMSVLAEAHGNPLGANVVDVRGIALARLESRLARLEETHRGVIAAAYENLSGTNQIHRAILCFMGPRDFPSFLTALSGDLAEILNVDVVRLVLETAYEDEEESGLARFDNVLSVVPKGFCKTYLGVAKEAEARSVTLRQIVPNDDSIYGRESDWIRSEACIMLDLGPGRLPGMLALGSEDPHKFKSSQGTDLLTFFGGVFERTMWRWLG